MDPRRLQMRLVLLPGSDECFRPRLCGRPPRGRFCLRLRQQFGLAAEVAVWVGALQEPLPVLQPLELLPH
jgi:hypothetical protein